MAPSPSRMMNAQARQQQQPPQNTQQRSTLTEVVALFLFYFSILFFSLFNLSLSLSLSCVYLSVCICYRFVFHLFFSLRTQRTICILITIHASSFLSFFFPLLFPSPFPPFRFVVSFLSFSFLVLRVPGKSAIGFKKALLHARRGCIPASFLPHSHRRQARRRRRRRHGKKAKTTKKM